MAGLSKISKLSKFIVLLIIVFSIVGMIDASYLTYEKISNHSVLCGEGFDCGAVLDSKWSNVGPIPLSMFGLVFYMMVWFVAVSVAVGVDFSEVGRAIIGKWYLVFGGGDGKKNGKWRDLSRHPLNFITGPEILLLLTSFGFLFSLYLVFLMGVVIKTWCLFCLISATTSTLLFILTIVYWKVSEKEVVVGGRKQVVGGRKQVVASSLVDSPIFLKSISFAVMRFLYKYFLKPVLFLFDAEAVHNFFLKKGEFLGRWSITRFLTKIIFSFSHKSLHKRIDGINFPNPVGLSAGFDYNGDLTGILPELGFGFHTIGTVTLEYYEGNPKPRLGRFPNSQALLVNKGLKSLGAKAVIKKLEKIQEEYGRVQRTRGVSKLGNAFKIPVGISIGSTNRTFKNTKEQIDNIVDCFKLFEKSKAGHSYYELNISCPNTHGGEPFYELKRLARLLRAVDRLDIERPVYVKMPIDQGKSETLKMLHVIDPHQIHGVIFGNLTKDYKNSAVKPADRREWRQRRGNLSGKPTWKRSNRLIKLTKRHYFDRFTIIGTGGVFSGADAQKKLNLGADLVQLITGMIYQGPQVLGEIGVGLRGEL